MGRDDELLEPKCNECNWVTKAYNKYKCLNPKCSKRNKEECTRIAFFTLNGYWPDEEGAS